MPIKVVKKKVNFFSIIFTFPRVFAKTYCKITLKLFWVHSCPLRVWDPVITSNPRMFFSKFITDLSLSWVDISKVVSSISRLFHSWFNICLLQLYVRFRLLASHFICCKMNGLSTSFFLCKNYRLFIEMMYVYFILWQLSSTFTYEHFKNRF